jgi:hypothetical protein
MNRVPVRLFTMVLILAATMSCPAYGAGELGVSADGVHWMSSITDPLFDESMVWVPGDSEAAPFYVRNQGGSPGDLTVDILGSRVGDLMDSGDLHVTATGGGGAWTTVSEGGKHRLLSTPRVPAGHVVAVHVTVAFDFASGNDTQLRAADLRFWVTLTQSTSTGSGGGHDGNGSGLPGTGAPDLRWYAALSSVLIGTGLAIVSRRHESPRKDHHV